MRKDKEKAIEMRREGKSYNEIYTALKIPVSTLSDWFGREEWSKAVRSNLLASTHEGNRVHMISLNKTRGEKLAELYAQAKEEAAAELKTLKYDPLFVSGVMLYWGEGAKDPKQGVKLINSDPRMIRHYVSFLKNSCGIPVESIKAHLIIYPDIEEKTARAYWSKMSGLPWENFTKSVVIQGRHPTRRLGWGVCTVSVSSTYFKQKMLEWIRLLPEELLRKEYYENI